jgi:protocatechuate 3,4-dioxygenase beta subunit
MGRTLRIVVSLVVACSVGVVGVPSEAQTTRTLTVTPAADLVDGDVVELHGAGFTPLSTVYFCQGVDDGSPGPEDCGGPIASVLADAAGEFVATYTVQRFIRPSSASTTIDCAQPSANCAIGSSDFFAPTPGSAFAPLNFTPLPPLTLTVTPDTDLVDGDVVTVHGVSFIPGSTVFICQGVDGGCRAPTQAVDVDAAGDFSAGYTVQRFLTTSGLTRTDCAAPSASCSIIYNASAVSGLVPITFAPQPPLPQISGTVTDAEGTPVPGVEVWAYTPSDTWVGSLQAVTDAQGAFAFAQVEPGVGYRILFRPPAGSSLGSEWWDERPGRRLATVITLSAAELTEVHAQLEEAGRISGSVTGPAGNPVSGAAVRVYGPGDTLIASHITVTASDGTYEIGNLRPAESGVDYRVLFSPPAGSGLVAEWFDDAARRALATAVTVPGGQTVAGIDAALEQAGAITGSVADGDGNPVSGVRVSAFGSGDTLVGSYATSTASDGTYRLGSVRPAAYLVRFSPPLGSGLAPEWFDDVPSRDQATDVTVSSGQTAAGIDAQLANAP